MRSNNTDSIGSEQQVQQLCRSGAPAKASYPALKHGAAAQLAELARMSLKRSWVCLTQTMSSAELLSVTRSMMPAAEPFPATMNLKAGRAECRYRLIIIVTSGDHYCDLFLRNTFKTGRKHLRGTYGTHSKASYGIGTWNVSARGEFESATSLTKG